MTAQDVAPDRNRTTVRRALRAGAALSLITLVLLSPTAFADNSPGIAVILFAALTAGGFATAGWLLLAALLDILAGEPLDRRRGAWTAAAVGWALLAPFLLLGALTQAATRGVSP